MEYLYYAFGGLLIVGLIVLLVRLRRWIGRSSAEGLDETRRFAEKLGLDILDARGKTLQGVVEGLTVTLDEGAILVKATEGRIGRMRTLRIVPVEFVGGLGGSAAALTRLLMIGLAMASPGRSENLTAP
jgi:hypothetical protein